MSKPDNQSVPPAQAEDDIPAGDSPPKPMWPLALAAAAWAAWMIFLVVMLIIRLHESPRG